MTSKLIPRVRFDNMRDRTASVPSGFEGELRANTFDEVTSVMRRAEAASRRGRWAAGYLSREYEPAFDGGLVLRERDPQWCSQLPLAWFGLFRDCVTTPLRPARVGSSMDWFRSTSTQQH